MANKARGEIALTMGGETLVLAATMANLGHFNEALGEVNIQEGLARLGPKDPDLTRKLFLALVLEGDGAAAWDGARGVPDMHKACKAINEALFPEEDQEGNAEAGAGTS